MRRISVFVAIAFLAGLGVGFFVGGGYRGVLQSKAHAADLAAIERLDQEDIEVTLSQDPKGLADVWAEDGVRITPGNPPTVGKAAIAAENEKGHAEHPEFKVLKYAPDVKNFQIAIADGWAIEVGSVEATYRLSAKDNLVNVNDKGMRLLKRQTDGSWKFALVGLR
jgi:uncharacterized protein (TIGR02246 family)